MTSMNSAVSINPNYLDNVLQAIEASGWKCDMDPENTETLVLTERKFSFGKYQLPVQVKSLAADLKTAVENFSVYGYIGKFTTDYTSSEAHAYRQQAWGIRQELKELASCVKQFPAEDCVKRFWMRAGISFDLTTEEFLQILAGGDAAEKIVRDKIASQKFTLDGDSYAPENMDDCPDDEWAHEEIGFDFSPMDY